MEKEQKHCQNCDTKYTIQWDISQQDLGPDTCPFCGYEVGEGEDDIEEIYDNWN